MRRLRLKSALNCVQYIVMMWYVMVLSLGASASEVPVSPVSRIQKFWNIVLKLPQDALEDLLGVMVATKRYPFDDPQVMVNILRNVSPDKPELADKVELAQQVYRAYTSWYMAQIARYFGIQQIKDSNSMLLLKFKIHEACGGAVTDKQGNSLNPYQLPEDFEYVGWPQGDHGTLPYMESWKAPADWLLLAKEEKIDVACVWQQLRNIHEWHKNISNTSDTRFTNQHRRMVDKGTAQNLEHAWALDITRKLIYQPVEEYPIPIIMVSASHNEQFEKILKIHVRENSLLSRETLQAIAYRLKFLPFLGNKSWLQYETTFDDIRYMPQAWREIASTVGPGLSISGSTMPVIENILQAPHLKNTLTTLILTGNDLTQLPTALWEFQDIANLQICSPFPEELKHNIDSIPPEISQLKNLTFLHLNGNQLRTIPSEIGQLRNLTDLALSNNQLCTLPDQLGYLEKLSDLNISYNKIDCLPASLNRLSNLQRLCARKNKLVTVFAGLFDLPKLEYLALKDNPLEYLPEHSAVKRVAGMVAASIEGCDPEFCGRLDDETLEKLMLASR